MAIATHQTFTLLGNDLFKAILQGNTSTSFPASTGMSIQSATQKFAFKFTVPIQLTITAVDVYMIVGGTTTGITAKAHIETDSSDAPSGSTVGSGTGAVAVPSASGLWGLQNMGASVTLNPNTQYWLVVEDGGGTVPTGTNFIQAANMCGTQGRAGGGIARQHNGTNWTTTAAVSTDGAWVMQDSNGNYWGCGFFSATNATGTQVFSTTRYGIKFRIGGYLKLAGVVLQPTKTGTPVGALEVSFYAGSTLIETITLAVADVVSARVLHVYLTTPHTTSPGVDYYVYIHQSGDAGSSSNCWRLQRVSGISATYMPSVVLPNWDTRSGTTADPTGWSALTTESVLMLPIIKDIGSDYQLPTIAS
jgi:hypothetical protein